MQLARTESGYVKRSSLDLPTLLRQVLSEEPDRYAALSVILNHARGVIGFGGGAALSLDEQGDLAAVWSAESDQPTASSALLSDVGGTSRLALAYVLLPLRTMPKTLLALMRSVPESAPASESLPRAEVEKLQDIARVAAPLLDHVEEHSQLQKELVDLRRRAQDQLEPSQRSNVDHILKSGRKLHKILTQAIEIAYAAAGKLTLMMQPVDLVGLLKDCVSMVRADAVEAGVTIEVTAPELDAPLVISTDAQRTSQIVLNLLSNAIKASSRKQSVSVAVRLDEHTAFIDVIDKGPGIPPHLLPRLFIPFAAADADGDAEAALGLPLSHSLATALGGSLTVASEAGEGSRFWLTLARR